MPLSTLVAIIAFVGGVGGGLVFPILPALGLELGIPGFLVGLILSSNRIARLIFNLPAGRLYHRLGPRLTLTGALLVEAVGMLGFSVALHSSIPAAWLLGGRFVYGIGMAFLLVGTQAAALGNSDRSNRGRQTAAVRVAINTAVPGGLILGGILADLYSDNVAFLAGAIVSFAGAVLAALLLPSGASAPARDGGQSRSQEPGEAPPAAETEYGYLALFRSASFPAMASAWSFNFLIFLTVQGALLSTLVLLIQQRHVSIFGMEAEGTSGIVMAIMVGMAAASAFAMGRAIDAAASAVDAAGSFADRTCRRFCRHRDGPHAAGGAAGGGHYGPVLQQRDAADDGPAGRCRQRTPAGSGGRDLQWCGDVGGTIGPMLGIEMATRLGLTALYWLMAAVSALAIVVAIWLRRYERRKAGETEIGCEPPSAPQQSQAYCSAPSSHQLQALQAGMAELADDDVIVHGDAERLGDIDHLLGHLDIGGGRRRVAGRVVVDEDDGGAQIAPAPA